MASAPASTPSPAFSPTSLGPVSLRNRIIKAATFEGATPRGQVTDRLVGFHAAVARGGAALTTGAHCAGSPGGPGHPPCMVVDDRTAAHLRPGTHAPHARGAAGPAPPRAARAR